MNFFAWNYELFPTKWSAVVFVSYMALFINQGILVTATKSTDGTYNYNTTVVVLLTESVKLVIACFLYIRDQSTKSLISEIFVNVKVLGWYTVPAALYAAYNNLAFVNLSAFNPTTYFLLLQFRVVVTGILFQVLFKKSLSVKQWLSLVLLTIGCLIKEMPSFSLGGLVIPHFSINLPLILIQVFCSCFAGVYNEYLLKSSAIGVHIMLQNIFLYIDSIFCNIGMLWAQGTLSDVIEPTALQPLFDWKVLGIIVNNAAIGIVTSFFLQSLNSILKTFASALELMFTAVLCWVIFGIPIDIRTVVAIMMVSAAVYIYAQNPVINKPKQEATSAALILKETKMETNHSSSLNTEV
ncbi:hypothetical protein CHUAL_003741 [Chamberlinius hualienensis]